MFGIGMPEMILILAVALIVIGPKKLPDLAKSLGRAIGEFKKAATDFKESMDIDHELKDMKNSLDDVNKDIKQSITLKSEAKDQPPQLTPLAESQEDANTKDTAKDTEGSLKNDERG